MIRPKWKSRFMLLQFCETLTHLLFCVWDFTGRTHLERGGKWSLALEPRPRDSSRSTRRVFAQCMPRRADKAVPFFFFFFFKFRI
jgi:hypothetical protein